MAEKYKLSNNESHQLTMEAIIQAFEILSEKKGVSEISVTELCQKAGVSRAGFYLNYKSVEDVMHEVMQKKAEDFFSDVYDRYDPTTESDFWTPVIEFFLKNEAFWRSIIRSHEEVYLIDLLNEQYENYVLPHVAMDKLQFYFWTGGFLMMLRQWLLNGKKEPIEEVVAVLSPPKEE